ARARANRPFGCPLNMLFDLNVTYNQHIAFTPHPLGGRTIDKYRKIIGKSVYLSLVNRAQ
ncbi:MAG: hypothetical protein SPK08_06300, partial [Candidatus Cryptobacteroides sp.]|nr:hypothetical protein [Rikenellaceae bacterium]MDY5747125.1 hypothetical protein [Candidatus Cryptobacteroides sp.]